MLTTLALGASGLGALLAIILGFRRLARVRVTDQGNVLQLNDRRILRPAAAGRKAAALAEKLREERAQLVTVVDELKQAKGAELVLRRLLSEVLTELRGRFLEVPLRERLLRDVTHVVGGGAVLTPAGLVEPMGPNVEVAAIIDQVRAFVEAEDHLFRNFQTERARGRVEAARDILAAVTAPGASVWPTGSGS